MIKMTIPIKDSNIVRGLWYDVLVEENNKKVHYVCPYSKCKSYEEAIEYYFKTFHNEQRKPIHVTNHGYTKDNLNMMLSAC